MNMRGAKSQAELRASFEVSMEGLRDTLRDDPGIRHIGVHATVRPGRHWLFTPHAHNALLWWREVLTSQNEIRRSLVECWTLHMQRELGEYVRQIQPVLPPTRRRVNTIGQMRDTEVRHLASVLYSFREKIAWLLYEILSITSHLPIRRNRVGFSSVFGTLRTLLPAIMETSKRDRLIKSLQELDGEDAHAVVAFRHNVIHALRPRVDTEQPPLMLRQADGSWDSQSPSPIYARRILHCATWMWSTCVDAVREIAACDLLPHVATTVRTQEWRQSQLPIHLHHGLNIRADRHRINVRCMSQCQGVIGELFVDQKMDEKGRSVAFDILSRVLERCLTIYDFEYRGAHASRLQTPHSVILMLVREIVDPRTQNEIATENAVKDIEHHDFRFVPLGTLELTRAASFSDWPERAHEVMRQMMIGAPPLAKVVSESANGNIAMCKLIYRPHIKERVIVKDLTIAGPSIKNLVIKTWFELATVKARR